MVKYVSPIRVVVTAILLFLSINLSAEEDYNPIITSVPSLSIAPDAHATGLGDVGAATEPNVNSQYWNASKYAQMESPAGFALSFTPWLSQLVNDINLTNLTGYMKIGELQSVSASLRYFSLGEVILRQSLGDQGYTIQPYEMALDVAYSRMLSQYYSMSVALRYIYSDLMSSDDPAGNAFAADISGFYRRP
ncbi:MAG: PorV/PorQ family protein, partial [Bacteroidales bacterium]|nr:PorV/PorQ family protein [Bacteroidales bacterium]